MIDVNEGTKTVQRGGSPGKDIRTWQQHLIRAVFRVLLIIGSLATVVSTYNVYEGGEMWLIPIYLGAYALLFLLAVWPRSPYLAQVGTLLGLVYGLGVLGLFESGLSGDGRVFLITLPFLAGLFLGRRWGFFALFLTILTLAGFAWAFSSGHLVIPIEAQANTAHLSSWISGGVVFVMLSLLLLFSQNYLTPRLVAALIQSRELTQELKEHKAKLEEDVAARTADLVRRSAQLETASQVARKVTAIQDEEILLQKTTRLISEGFGFYHTAIYLLDETGDGSGGEYVVLRAVSSADGQQRLAQGLRLQVGEDGVVGHVAGSGQPHIVVDVEKDDLYLDHPDLSLARSEMALPLWVHGRTIGVLDVLSTEAAAFDQEDMSVLQALADQIVVALENVRLLRRVQESLEAERRAYGELSREAWSELFRAQLDLGERYDPQGILPTAGRWREEAKQAIQKGRTVLSPVLAAQDQSPMALAVPLKVRGQVIGVLDALKPTEAGGWTTEEIALVETLSDRLGMALESARLYQATQRRAAQEQLLGEVTARVRESLDLDTVLQTAVREMGEALGIAEVEVRLGAVNPDSPHLATERKES